MKTKISKFLSNYKGLISPLTTIAIGLFVGGLIEFIFDRYDETFDLDTEIKRENNEK